MSENAEFIVRLQGQLDQRANPRTKAWWERYLRHSIPFRGVNLAAQGDGLFAGFVDMLLSVCAATVRHEERFPKRAQAGC